MDFYILSPDKNDFHFPVNPEKITIQGEKQIETVDILNIGEIDFATGNRRTGIKFSSFLPKDYDSYCQYSDLPDPNDAIEKLTKYRDAGKPVRLLISESPINSLVLISNVDFEIRGGEPDDIYFDIQFREYREVKIRKTTRVVVVPKKPRPSTKPKPKMYVVVKGDSLWKIAKKHLNSGTAWTKIYNIPENKKTIGSNPSLIYPGQKLVIPS